MKIIPIETCSIDNRGIVFAISLENNKTAYMTCKRTYALNKERAIVILDAKKFQTLWKADPNPIAPELSNGTRENWIKDSKYHDAEIGFQQGKENPVPLPKIAFHEFQNTLAYINFTNGITRTIWLLANGATAFPIECNASEAERLSLSAGLEPGKYSIVADILKN